MVFKSLLIIFFLLMQSACQTSQSSPSKFAASDQFSKATPEEVMAQYQEAMNLFWTHHDPQFTKALKPYKDLYKKMGWALMTLDSNVTAINQGNFMGFFVVFHPDHPSLKKWAPTFSTDSLNGKPVVLIRPDKISMEWIPMAIIHELAHVRYNTNGVNLDKVAEELAGYTIEKLALSAITQLKFDKELLKVLEELALKSEMQILDIDSKKMEVTLLKMDKNIFSEASRSHAELEMRLGFYYMALAIKIVENTNVSKEQQSRRLIQFSKKFLDQKARKH